jgi:ATP-dependent Clp protease ATP-binding subunit ClpB
MLEGEKEKLLGMERIIEQRVVGQDEAITAISDAVRRSRSGIQDPNRPVGSFIFLGPTGVGKTETAKAVAEFLFNDEKAITRIDMSEYMESIRYPGSSGRLRATSDTMRADSSPRPYGEGPTR